MESGSIGNQTGNLVRKMFQGVTRRGGGVPKSFVARKNNQKQIRFMVFFIVYPNNIFVVNAILTSTIIVHRSEDIII